MHTEKQSCLAQIEEELILRISCVREQALPDDYTTIKLKVCQPSLSFCA